MMEREEGFYWVRSSWEPTLWEVGEWAPGVMGDGELGMCWYICGHEDQMHSEAPHGEFISIAHVGSRISRHKEEWDNDCD